MRQLLSHQSGAIGLPGSDALLGWDGAGWDDTEAIAAGVAAGEPAWEPGTRHGYHGVTFGWLVGELVRRISGGSLGRFFATEVAEPLGAACSIGTPADPQLASVATVHGVPGEARARRARWRPSTRRRSRAARCWPGRTGASSPTRTGGPGSPTS